MKQFLGLLLILVLVGCANTPVTNNANTNVIEIKGSDTLLQLVSNEAEAFSKDNPDIKVTVTGGGSGTGIAALINGEVDIADASRPMKAEEINQAIGNRANPYEVIIAKDMLSVIVNPDNKVKELTVDQISKIFSGQITNWRDVGGKDEDITLYGRQSTSGTYVFFMEEIVKDDYSDKMRNMEGNQAILDAVRQDKSGIGYVGIGYIVDENGDKVDGINVINVAQDKDSEYISPLDTEKLATYPISRALYQYLAQKPEKTSSVYKFIQFELNSAGQDIVKETGFVKISDDDKVIRKKS